MSSSEKCCQCLEIFKLSNPPRILPSCQHNICTKCLKEVIQNRQEFIECQFCFNKTKNKQIKLFQKNMKLLSQIKNNSILSSDSTINSHELSVSKIDDDFQDSIFKNQELLISQMDEQTEKQNVQFCMTHKKALDIICITEKKRICPHCAIFGNHKDHRFKTIKQFQEEVKQKSQQFNKILEGKEKIQKNQVYSDIKAQMVLKLNKRKQYLANQISANFENLIKQINNAQKMIQEELSQKFQKAKEKIDQTLTEQKRIKKKFMAWEEQCQDVLNRLDKTTNVNQRANVFYESSLEICKEGQLYLEQMQKSLEKMIESIQDQVNAISIKIQDINITKFASLVFPILSEKQIKSSGSKGSKQSFQLPTSSFVQQITSQDELQDNSFIFEQEISSIMSKDKEPLTLNKTAKKGYNKKLESSFLGNTSQCSMFLPQVSGIRKKIQFQKDKEKHKTTLNRVKSNPRIFKSPQYKPGLVRSQVKKNVAQVMDLFVKNDLTNQLDLSECHLNNQQLLEYVEKASKIRVIKALKVQSNKLTDFWLQKLFEHIKSVTNLNLSYNFLTNHSFQIILKNIQILKNLKIINLKHNKIQINKNQRKWTTILQQFKRHKIMLTID